MEPVPIADTPAAQRILVLNTLYSLGQATSVKIGLHEGRIHNSHARCAELKAAWLIEEAGWTWSNPSGRKAALLQLTASGKVAEE